MVGVRRFALFLRLRCGCASGDRDRLVAPAADHELSSAFTIMQWLMVAPLTGPDIRRASAAPIAENPGGH